jgi:dolichyl-phosphate-mannose-protein mannosyltransferase
VNAKAEQRESETQESRPLAWISEPAAPEPSGAPVMHRSTGLESERTDASSLSRPTMAVVWIAILLVALTSLYFFYSRGLSNLYGDGIAHMEGARRLWDSLTPGYSEIGSVWLPLYHILASPLALNDTLWRTGLAGSIVSTAAFALTAWLLFRLAGEMNRNVAAGVVAFAVFIACPNMLYLASTPLTEPLALLWSVLVVYELFRYRETGRRGALIGAALAALCGTLTRYDGWFLLPFAAIFVFFARRESWRERFRHTLLFSLIAGAGPVLWVLHNAIRFGNPLEFYNGPYSAQAIYAHQLSTSGFRYPTAGSLLLSARYYLEDLKLVIGPWPLELAVLGLVAWAAGVGERARRSAALLLVAPLPFYLQSMAHAAVPLYVPTLFPNTYYNLRYGIEMLPGVAILASFLIAPGLHRRVRWALIVGVAGVCFGGAVSMSARGASELAVVKEGELNTPCRSQTEQAMIRFLRANYDGQVVLMTEGKYPCVPPQVGIPFRKTLSEANRRYWLAMRFGAQKWAGWVIRSKGDSIDQLMRRYPEAFSDFDLVAKYRFPGEDGVDIYRRRK